MSSTSLALTRSQTGRADQNFPNTWQRFARCNTYDTDIFFPPENEAATERAQRELLAKRICRDCPVLVLCRTQAIRTQENYGIWGGLAERERLHLRRHPGPGHAPVAVRPGEPRHGRK